MTERSFQENSMFDSLASVYERFSKWASCLGPFALLILRLGWGWEMIESGHGHLTHIQATTDFFTSLHIPFPRANVIISGSTELVGGILLVLGLGARLISIPLGFNFLVAILTASKDNVMHFFSQNPSKIVDDTAYPFLITSLIILAFGPGLFSIDGILKATLFDPKRKNEARGLSPVMPRM
jgi:putative oxidoreductase